MVSEISGCTETCEFLQPLGGRKRSCSQHRKRIPVSNTDGPSFLRPEYAPDVVRHNSLKSIIVDVCELHWRMPKGPSDHMKPEGGRGELPTDSGCRESTTVRPGGPILPYNCAAVGRTISHCRILKRLGGGGMGVVHKGVRYAAARLVALGRFVPDERGQKIRRHWRDFSVARLRRRRSALNHRETKTGPPQWASYFEVLGFNARRCAHD